MRYSGVAILALAAISEVAAQSSSISQATFDNIIQYTRFSRAAYAVQGCTTPPNSSTVLQYIDDSVNDGHATIFRYDSAQQIVLAFRGTDTPANWNSDLDFIGTGLNIAGTKCSNCNVHEGFQKVYNGLASKVLAGVKAALAANPSYSFVITGHSLGGALASLGTAHLGANGVKIAYTYTYGEPRNGDANFGKYVYSFVPLANYFRVTHANDGVPQVPPSLLGFQHHGNEYWEKATGYNNTASTTVLCPPPSFGENTSCNLGQSNDIFINHAHVTYSNDVIGNVLHIHDCGAPYP